MSDEPDRYANYRTLRQTFKDVRDYYAKAIDAERARLTATCTHPDEFVQERSSERGNGYGSLAKRTWRVCEICERENHWGTWHLPSD